MSILRKNYPKSKQSWIYLFRQAAMSNQTKRNLYFSALFLFARRCQSMGIPAITWSLTWLWNSHSPEARGAISTEIMLTSSISTTSVCRSWTSAVCSRQWYGTPCACPLSHWIKFLNLLIGCRLILSAWPASMLACQSRECFYTFAKWG